MCALVRYLRRDISPSGRQLSDLMKRQSSGTVAVIAIPLAFRRAARSSRLEPPSRRHREPSQRHARATHCPAGAYWEAGFAEGLGKPVIYICRAKEGDAEKKTHFDANHRHTVRWDLSTLDETAKN